jgi:hypothetical protein
LKEIIMNAKPLLAALSIAFAGTAAMATEATQFEPQAGTLTRAEVKAELARTQANAAPYQSGESYGSFALDAKAATSERSREDVRAGARQAGRTHAFNSLYVGA